ncbi:hypothetical protein BH10BAC5_BH10BAC5_24030 [soil metagenome]
MIDIKDTDGRYSRFELISWWDQDILKNSRIMVVGCGALGNEIIKNLAMLGVGNILAVDMDKVEKSNLSRSILFREEDLGKSKSQTACERAREINPDISIKSFEGSIFEIGIGCFKNIDIVICGLDNREARLFVNRSCRKAGIPWIDGAIEVLNGIVRVFTPFSEVCYECTMTELDHRLLNRRRSCLMLRQEEIEQGRIPTTPTISSVIAGIQVQEAVKYLHMNKNNDLKILDGKGLVINGISNDNYIVEYQPQKDCPSHYYFDKIISSDISFNEITLKDVFDAARSNFKSDKVKLDFNNEIVFMLYDDDTGEQYKNFSNMNLMQLKNIIKSGNDDIEPAYYKFNSIHNTEFYSEFYNEYKDVKLIDMKIPYNDIITATDGMSEIYISPGYIDVFK